MNENEITHKSELNAIIAFTKSLALIFKIKIAK